MGAIGLVAERSTKDAGSVSHAARAYEAIRGAILDVQYQPGDALYEVELAERLEMSRTPVREAIRQLVSEGLVRTVPYRGTFVKAVSKDEAREIYETAEGLEGMAAFLAALHASEDDVARLRDAVDTMERALRAQEIDVLIEADEQYHEALHRACKNAYLVASLNRLYGQVHRIRLITARLRVDSMKSVEDHRATADAVNRRDPERARHSTHRHWARVRDEMLQVIP